MNNAKFTNQFKTERRFRLWIEINRILQTENNIQNPSDTLSNLIHKQSWQNGLLQLDRTKLDAKMLAQIETGRFGLTQIEMGLFALGQTGLKKNRPKFHLAYFGPIFFILIFFLLNLYTFRQKIKNKTGHFGPAQLTTGLDWTSKKRPTQNMGWPGPSHFSRLAQWTRLGQAAHFVTPIHKQS